MFTKEVLSRNSGKPCYILEFYTAEKQYSYKVDAVSGEMCIRDRGMDAWCDWLRKQVKDWQA